MHTVLHEQPASPLNPLRLTASPPTTPAHPLRQPTTPANTPFPELCSASTFEACSPQQPDRGQRKISRSLINSTSRRGFISAGSTPVWLDLLDEGRSQIFWNAKIRQPATASPISPCSGKFPTLLPATPTDRESLTCLAATSCCHSNTSDEFFATG